MVGAASAARARLGNDSSRSPSEPNSAASAAHRRLVIFGVVATGELETSIGRKLIAGEIKDGAKVVVTVKDGRLAIEVPVYN